MAKIKINDLRICVIPTADTDLLFLVPNLSDFNDFCEFALTTIHDVKTSPLTVWGPCLYDVTPGPDSSVSRSDLLRQLVENVRVVTSSKISEMLEKDADSRLEFVYNHTMSYDLS